jgi:hypothetical protein
MCARAGMPEEIPYGGRVCITVFHALQENAVVAKPRVSYPCLELCCDWQPFLRNIGLSASHSAYGDYGFNFSLRYYKYWQIDSATW